MSKFKRVSLVGSEELFRPTRPEVVVETDDAITEVLDRKPAAEKLLRTLYFTPDEIELLLESVQTAKYPDKARKPSLDKFERLVKRAPTHLDSHHHVGLHAPVAGVVLAAARRLGIPVRSQDAAARARARSAGLRTPDHFFGESGPGAYWSLARTLAHLRALPPGVSEFMTHPGWCDDALAYSRYGRQRETELVGLGTPAARAAALALGLTLCHFGDL